jgi:hypothetical protein
VEERVRLLATFEPQLPAGHDLGMSYVGDDLADHNGVTAGNGFISLTRTLWRQRFLREASQCVICDVLRQANCYF